MGGNDRPLVSVLMGVRYQRENLFLLERSINSILRQTYSDLEFLICERDSTPAARARLEQYAQEDKRVKLVDGTGAKNFSEQLNRCFCAAQGAYLARMDDDDFSFPERIETQIKYLNEHKEIAFVGSTARLERDGEYVGTRSLPEQPQVRDFLFVQPFLHPTLIFRKETLERAAGYDEDHRCNGCEDYDLLLRLYEMGLTGANIQAPLLTYTLPPFGSKKRTIALRWNEAKTRFVRFCALGLLPGAMPYVVKPLAVGALPVGVVEALKERRRSGGNSR